MQEIVDEILVPLTYAFDALVVCVDGIDMCDEYEQTHVWSGLRKMSEQRATRGKNTRTLITGQNESKLAVLMPADALRLHLDRGMISSDIEIYIDARLQERAHHRQLFHDAELRATVKKTLLQRAENM